jgi:DNA-binding MarR family transcriptional regulator
MLQPTDRIDTHTGYLLVKLGVSAGARFERSLAPLGLRSRHVRVLEVIRGEGLSQRDLCRLTGMDRTTMVAVVDELERLGHVRRERSLSDRRKQVVTITESGIAAFTEAAARLTAAEQDLLAPLSRQERDQLHRLVSHLFTPQDADCAPETAS